MKHLTLVVHAGLEQATTDLLRSIEGIDGFTMTPVEGHGAQAQFDPVLSSRDRVVGYVPRLRIDMLLTESQLGTVLAAFQVPKPGINIQQGVYWVTDVVDQGRF